MHFPILPLPRIDFIPKLIFPCKSAPALHFAVWKVSFVGISTVPYFGAKPMLNIALKLSLIAFYLCVALEDTFSFSFSLTILVFGPNILLPLIYLPNAPLDKLVVLSRSKLPISTFLNKNSNSVVFVVSPLTLIKSHSLKWVHIFLLLRKLTEAIPGSFAEFPSAVVVSIWIRLVLTGTIGIRLKKWFKLEFLSLRKLWFSKFLLISMDCLRNNFNFSHQMLRKIALNLTILIYLPTVTINKTNI